MTVEKLLRLIIVCGILLIIAISVEQARAANPLTETRYCGAPVRDAAGTIVRSAVVKATFRRANPCPSTGLTHGACPNYSIQHPIPLACGGCDAVSNMEWMRNDVKKIHDSYERKIYGRGIPDTANCSSPPIGGIK